MTSKQETYQLDRNDFEQSTQAAFRGLLTDQDFSDLTLVCAGNRQVQAHKVILGSSSPFFKSVLMRNPHQHPLLYLKGVQYEDLQAILRFIYAGKTSVSEANLDRFLASAQELEVEGLRIQQGEEKREQETAGETIEKAKDGGEKYRCENCDFQTIYKKSMKRHSESLVACSFKYKEKEKAEKEVATTAPGPLPATAPSPLPVSGEKYRCANCDFETSHKFNLMRHLGKKDRESTCPGLSRPGNVKTEPQESKPEVDSSSEIRDALTKPSRGVEEEQERQEEDGTLVRCGHCDSTFNCKVRRQSRDNLRRHLQRTHKIADPNMEEEMKIKSKTALTKPADCSADAMDDQMVEDLEVTDKVSTESEINDFLEELDDVDEENTMDESLAEETGRPAKAAKEAPEKLTVFSCDRCEFTEESKWNLTKHMLQVHKEMKYPCDYCDYKASQTYRINEHIQKKH